MTETTDKPVTLDQELLEPTEQHGLAILHGQHQHLERRLAAAARNRRTFLQWLGANLINGIDYGQIHITKKCRMKPCTNPWHYSKKILFKPGAEKISAMIGARPHWPALRDYEEQAVAGNKIVDIILRCELLDAKGRIIGEGVGGRTVDNDRDPLNKALKMCKKSGHIDAVISTAGVSEIFTLDIDDTQPPKTADLFDEVDLCPLGPKKGHPIDALTNGELRYVLDESSDADLRERIKAILEARERGEDTQPTAQPVSEPTQGDDGAPSMREAYDKIGQAITLAELDQLWESMPERYRTPFTKAYDDRRAEIEGADNG